jgi:hypothetical protein
MINHFLTGPFRDSYYDDEHKILDMSWHETGFMLQALCLSWVEQNFAHHADFIEDNNPDIPNVFVDANGNTLKGSDMLLMWEKSWAYTSDVEPPSSHSLLNPLSESDIHDLRLKTAANVTYSSLIDAWGNDLVNKNLENFNLNDRHIKLFDTIPKTNNGMWEETPKTDNNMWASNPSHQVHVTGGTAYIGDVTIHTNGNQQTVTVKPKTTNQNQTQTQTQTQTNPNTTMCETSKTYTTKPNSGLAAKLRGIGSKLAANAAEVARHIVADDLT